MKHVWAWTKRIAIRMSRDNVSLLAAAVTFYVFVAIPSSITAIVSLYGLVFNIGDIQEHIAFMEDLFPTDATKILSDLLATLVSDPASVLGSQLAMGILVAVWSGQSAASSLVSALDAVYEKREARGFFAFQLTALAIALSWIVLAIVAVTLFSVGPWFIDRTLLFHLPAAIIRWPILIVLVASGIGALYRYAPAQRPEYGWGKWGIALATTLSLGGSALFALYVEYFTSYDVRYGTLGAAVVMLLWLYVMVFAVLLGAELNADLEGETPRKDQAVPLPPGQILPDSARR